MPSWPLYPLDDVDRGVPSAGSLVVAGREVNPQWPHVRVIERIAAQQRAVDGVPLDAAGDISRPRQHDHSFVREVSAGAKPATRVSVRSRASPPSGSRSGSKTVTSRPTQEGEAASGVSSAASSL